MAAPAITATNGQAANAGAPHSAERNFLGTHHFTTRKSRARLQALKRGGRSSTMMSRWIVRAGSISEPRLKVFRQDALCLLDGIDDRDPTSYSRFPWRPRKRPQRWGRGEAGSGSFVRGITPDESHNREQHRLFPVRALGPGGLLEKCRA